jgi:hypothetical protein
MSIEYSEALLSLILTPDPSIGSVVQLFSNYLQADHYLLIEMPFGQTPHFIVTSDLIIPHVTLDPSIWSFDLPHIPHLHSYDSPLDDPQLGQINSIFYLPINDHLFILLINPESATPLNEILISTQTAVHHLHSICQFDVSFTLSVIHNLTIDDISSVSLVSLHPSYLLLITVAYFIQTGLCEMINIDSYQLFKFILNVRAHYNDVPYHNWFHAIDTIRFIYNLNMLARFDRFLTNLELFALFIAAICHDIDHDGLNNSFHRNAKTKLAHLAPNLPPLEHHHCCVSCDLLNPLLSTLSENDQSIILHFVIDCIMATDMEKHKDLINSWSNVIYHFDCQNPTHRLLLGQMIMKAADLSNVVRHFDESERLSTMLIIETHRQGNIEIQLGLPLSPMCNPNDETPLCVGQVGFYEFVAGPLMKQLLAFFPEIEASVKQFEANLIRWKEQKARWESHKSR